MRLSLAIGLAVAVMLGAGAQAEGIPVTPAEAPSEYFKGNQYVDTRGCIFDRVAEAWILRSNQMRVAICRGDRNRSLVTTASTRGGPGAGQVIVPVTVSSGAIRYDRTVSPAALAREIEMRDGRTVFSGGLERLRGVPEVEGVPILVPPAQNTFDVSRPPPGFKVAWKDGRLNPHRGPRTLLGDLQSRGIWTSETPRRLRPVILRQVRR
ncbi:MAG: hypothetical protein AAFY65_01065 [Pseudomonadota bacterium]